MKPYIMLILIRSPTKIKQATQPRGEISVFDERLLTIFKIFYGSPALDTLVKKLDEC